MLALATQFYAQETSKGTDWLSAFLELKTEWVWVSVLGRSALLESDIGSSVRPTP